MIRGVYMWVCMYMHMNSFVLWLLEFSWIEIFFVCASENILEVPGRIVVMYLE